MKLFKRLLGLLLMLVVVLAAAGVLYVVVLCFCLAMLGVGYTPTLLQAACLFGFVVAAVTWHAVAAAGARK